LTWLDYLKAQTMNLQQLEYFLVSFDRGSFSAAAHELHLAQPSVSEQVRALEAELGAALFTRVGRGLQPTEAGRELRPHAERVLHAVEAARESVVAVRELRGGTASFGIWGHARFYPGMDIVAEFRDRHPNVRVRLLGLNSVEVVEALRSGDVEAGLVALPIDDRGLDVRPVTRDEVVYVSTDRARLRGAIDIRRVAQAPLVLPDASYGAMDPTRRQLGELAQREGVTMEPQIDVEDIESALDLVAQGHGDTIVSHGVLWNIGDRVPANVGWAPFAEPIYDTFAFAWRRGAQLSPAAREFLALAEEALLRRTDELRRRAPRRRRPG
jgi:DNA-binding transcriptional LysR family regulator